MLTGSSASDARGVALVSAGSPNVPISPADRARHFVDHLPRLSAHEWDEILQRVHAVDATAHAEALRRVTDLLGRHPNVDAMGTLQRAACDAAPRYTGAGRLATHAAFALALRDALSAREFAALYGPFARPESPTAAPRPGAADGEPPLTDRRIAVDALADVARPLASEDDTLVPHSGVTKP